VKTPPPEGREQPSCFDRAVGLLSRRAHFEAELEAKLRARRYPGGEIAQTLAKLRSLGYLDDPATAERWLAGERRRRAQGRRRLRHRLERKGVDPEVVEAALEGFDDATEIEEARRAADAWSARHSPDPERLARHLDSRGFAKRAILVVLEARPDVCESS
jgi:regulatory protein